MKTLSFSNFSTNVHTHVNFSLWTLIRLFKQNIKFSFPFTHPFIMVRSISMLMMMMKLCKKEITSIRSPKLYVWVKCRVYWKRRWFNDKSTWMYCGRVWLFSFFFFCLFSLFIVGFYEWTGWLSKIGYESETAYAYAYDLNEWKKWNRNWNWNDQVKFWQRNTANGLHTQTCVKTSITMATKKIVNEQNKFPYHWSSVRAMCLCVCYRSNSYSFEQYKSNTNWRSMK